MFKYLGVFLLATVVSSIIGVDKAKSWVKARMDEFTSKGQETLTPQERLGLLKIVMKGHAARLAKMASTEKKLEEAIQTLGRDQVNTGTVEILNTKLEKSKNSRTSYLNEYNKAMARLVAIETMMQIPDGAGLGGPRTLDTPVNGDINEQLDELERGMFEAHTYSELITYPENR